MGIYKDITDEINNILKKYKRKTRATKEIVDYILRLHYTYPIMKKIYILIRRVLTYNSCNNEIQALFRKITDDSMIVSVLKYDEMLEKYILIWLKEIDNI